MSFSYHSFCLGLTNFFLLPLVDVHIVMIFVVIFFSTFSRHSSSSINQTVLSFSCFHGQNKGKFLLGNMPSQHFTLYPNLAHAVFGLFYLTSECFSTDITPAVTKSFFFTHCYATLWDHEVFYLWNVSMNSKEAKVHCQQVMHMHLTVMSLSAGCIYSYQHISSLINKELSHGYHSCQSKHL